MKRIWVIVVNVLITLGLLTFVVVYSSAENRETIRKQTEHFESMTVTMQSVTENYLEGEQRICDVWSHYINSKEMTIEDAASFIGVSHVLPKASAHIVDLDTMEGLSTRRNDGTAVNYPVSYANTNLLADTSWIQALGTSQTTINVSRTFANPVNGEQSIAFCNFVNLKDKNKSVLLRVLPVEELMEKWVFPQEEFKSAELSVIDEDGEYVIKGDSFKGSSFFEFYQTYNAIDSASAQEFFQKTTTTTGSFRMLNSAGKECLLAYTPVHANGRWGLLSMVPMENLASTTQNWLLIGIVASGLLALFVFDFAVMIYFNKRLQATAQEAKSASKAKTDFLSTMSHDIRTPMNAIIGLTTITEKNIGDEKIVRENLRKISLASNHLLSLINDILDISKVESGKLSLVPQTFSIVETAENLVNLSQPMVKEKNIDFGFHVNRIEKEYLYADQLRLNQIYINILSNAIKYTEPRGRVVVGMKEEESPKPGCVRLIYSVADTGIGMTPEFMTHMYQAFSRQTDSRVNSIQGTGLGLAITKRMVDLMEGTIECQSEPGKGTTFTVTLDIPVSDQQKAEQKFENLEVLIVDDDPIILETGADTLKSLGLAVEEAQNGLEALGMIKHRQETGKNYDIAILDIKMPDIDGVELVRRIRSELKSDVPVLLISAYSWSDVEEQAKEAGVNGFLSKPLFRSTVRDKVSEILGTEIQSTEQENDYSDIEGLNILVAEDNDINWEIISALLEMHGITAERAENGRVCVEKMKNATKGKYALIFMDVQMPEMNGLDATRAIRTLEDPWASSIPIVAMTADAFAENITECLNAGMNGHIAKPIDMKLVIKEIRRINGEAKL